MQLADWNERADALSKLKAKYSWMGVADPAYNLTKKDKTVYHIAIDKWGPTCSCADHTFRERFEGCKHLKAAFAVGLLEKPK